jgi:Skp family chaperone for outer membrane proteins
VQEKPLKNIDFQKLAPVTVAAALTALLTTFIYGTTAQAKQDKSVPLPNFGSVNLQRVVQESKGNKTDADDFRKYAEGLDQTLKRLASGGARFLSEAEIKELATLYLKPMPTQAEKTRIGDLEDKGTLAGNKKKRLESTPTPSEADKKDFADLTTAEEKGIQTLRALQADYTKLLENRDEELGKKLEGEVRTAVAKVAKDRGLTVVFNNTTVVYAATDVTDDVIKAMNK